MASHSYYVCLGMEEREAGAPSKAQSLVDDYCKRGCFADFSYSLHPGNIIGESAGKSSNVNWAARHMARRRDVASQRRTIVTVMDADTAFASDFFLASAAHFSLARPEIRRRMMFVPPTLFDRNSADVPIFTRATDIFWSCAGIGGIYPSSWCKIPTSAYAVSLDLARFCDFWDAGPEAIGEDLHFYCKAMFETKGNVSENQPCSAWEKQKLMHFAPGQGNHHLLSRFAVQRCRQPWNGPRLQLYPRHVGPMDAGHPPPLGKPR